MKKLILAIMLVVFLAGCSYMDVGPQCAAPSIAMTDVNGNTVCVMPSNTTEECDDNVSKYVDNETETQVGGDSDSASVDDERSAAEVLEDLREESGVNADAGDASASVDSIGVDASTGDEGVSAGDTAQPTLDVIPEIVVDEGDMVSFPNLRAYDPDNDPLTFTFESPLDANGEWQTNVGDAGVYMVTVSVTDQIHVVSQDVKIVVKSANKAPVIPELADVTVSEGDYVEADFDVIDPDGDSVDVAFSEPLDAQGRWQTKSGDEGVYKIEVTASDGQMISTESFIIRVEEGNNKPVIEDVDDFTVEEGDLVSLSPVVIDADGDDVTVSYSGWMESSSYRTDYDDSGIHLVTITATDGKATVSEDVTITVEDVNRPPRFDPESFD